MRYFVDGLEWHGHTAFRAKEYLPVHRPSAEASRLIVQREYDSGLYERLVWGWHKRHQELSFMEIDQAGHLVPRDQPEVALAMINYWISGDL